MKASEIKKSRRRNDNDGTPGEERVGMLKPFGEKALLFIQNNPEYDCRITILEGAVRSSKTWALMIKMVRLCAYKVKGRRILVGFSRQSIINNVLTDLKEFVGDENFHFNQQTGELLLMGVKWWVCGAHDVSSEKRIRGVTVGIAVVDEASLVPESFWQMLISRMSPDGARLYASTNPDHPRHYLKRDYIDNPKLKASGMLRSIHFNLNDNPNLKDEYRQLLTQSYKGLFYQRFILGLWVAGSGSIYSSCFDDRNLFDESTRPLGLYGAGGYIARYIAVDVGARNPQVYAEILDDGLVAWVIRSYYWDSKEEEQQKTDAEYAADLEKFIRESPVRRTDDVQVIVDPSALSFRLELVKRGLFVKEADNEVLEGIRVTATMLGNKALRFHKDNCQIIIDEMTSYAWDDKASENGVEQPLKEHDHGPDAVRYWVKTEVNPWRLSQVAA
jgi:PBSX family phage terminase large subunit